jgi:hypothetical protein
MSDPSSMNGTVSHSSTQSALRNLEQGDLLGGADVGAGRREEGRKEQPPRRRHVGARPRLGFAIALALVVRHGRQQAKELGKTALSRCPRCGHVGPTERDFGTRIIRGERRPQSWCRGCRAEHLPPLKALGSSSGREVKASRGERAREKPAKTERPRRTRPEEGWLFPPELLGGGSSHAG